MKVHGMKTENGKVEMKMAEMDPLSCAWDQEQRTAPQGISLCTDILMLYGFIAHLYFNPVLRIFFIFFIFYFFL